MLEELAALGLTGEATPQQVKRAYLRKVKEHPPERDPEGFQRVRRAYEAALGALARRAYEAAQVPAPEGQTGESAGEPAALAAETPPVDGTSPEPAPPTASGDLATEAAPRFPPHVSEQIELLNRALAEEDPEGAAKAMVELYSRPVLEEAPVPPAIFALRTFMVLAERERFVLGRKLLDAFDAYVTSHQASLGAGGEISARWRLAREVLATSDLDGRLAAALAMGLRNGRLFEARDAAQAARFRAPRTLEPHMRAHAPTLWSSIAPLLAYEVEQVAPPRPWSFSGASLWPVGLIMLLVVNLAKLCGPSAHTSSRSVPYQPPPVVADESERTPQEPQAASPAAEGSLPRPLPPPLPVDAPELRRAGSWSDIQLSLTSGDCDAVRAQWPFYVQARGLSPVDQRVEQARRLEVVRRCGELQELGGPKK